MGEAVQLAFFGKICRFSLFSRDIDARPHAANKPVKKLKRLYIYFFVAGRQVLLLNLLNFAVHMLTGHYLPSMQLYKCIYADL